MKFALGSNHDGNNTQTANELIADILDESVYAEEVGLYSAWVGSYPCGPRAIDGDTRPHPAAMAEMQKLLKRLITKHTGFPADWRLAMAQGREGQPAYGDIIQAAIGDHAAPRHAYRAPEYLAYFVLNGGHP